MLTGECPFLLCLIRIDTTDRSEPLKGRRENQAGCHNVAALHRDGVYAAMVADQQAIG